MIRAALIFLLLASPLAAADQRAAEMLERAQASLGAAKSPEERLAALGRAAQAQEAALRALRVDLRAAADRRGGIDAGLKAEERRFVAVLSALQRLESAPRVTLMAHPGGPVAAARAGMTLAAFAPRLEAEAGRLARALNEIAMLDAQRDTASAAARGSLAALQNLRGEIATLMDRDRRLARLPKEVEQRLADETAALSNSAASLRALAAALPPTPDDADTLYAAHFGAARTLTPPVEGAMERPFAAPGRGGPLEGVEIAAPAYASVYAPWRGVIRFAGPFGDDGVVVILEPDPEFLIVLAGLAATDRVAGETVLAGEPLGAMGGPAPAAEEFLIAATATVETIRAETLYMEVRRGGAPADPALWFAFDNEEGD